MMDMAWTPEDKRHMAGALSVARAALQIPETPVGCVVVRDGVVIGRGSNETNLMRNGTRHAEFVAIDGILADHGGDEQACAFPRCHLYVTCEPCIMCAGALSLLSFGTVTFGCGNDKFGGNGGVLSIHEHGCGPCGGHSLGSTYRSRGGLYAEEAIELLRTFYSSGNPAAPKPHRNLRRPELGSTE